MSFITIFGTLSFPISDGTPGTDFQGAVVQWGRTRAGGDYLADDARLLTTALQSADGSGASYYLSRGVRTFAHEHMPPTGSLLLRHAPPPAFKCYIEER